MRLAEATFLAAVLLNSEARAAPGDLDLAFGSGGRVTTSIGTDDFANALLLQPDGKVVAAGWSSAEVGTSSEFAVARYDDNGNLDPTFGTGGMITTPIPPSSAMVGGLVLQPDDGMIVAAGSASNALALARYDGNGNLDPTFGTGGIVTTSIGPFSNSANAVLLQPDEKLVTSGHSHNGEDADFLIVRYNPDGSLDPLFGSGGIVTTPVRSGDDVATSLILQPDGKLVAAGWAVVVGNDARFALVRYDGNGSLDPTFGAGGIVTTSFAPDGAVATDLILQPDGKLVAAGRATGGTGADFALARYGSDGALDTTFGIGGKLTTAIGPDHDWANSLLLQPDGKLVAAGYASNGSNADVAVVRYHGDGTLDGSFGSGGIVTTPFGTSDDVVNALVMTPAGRLVTAGWSSNGSNLDFALARYEGSICGNEVPEAGEDCDDGNLDDGDCCSATCTLEIGSPCSTTTTSTSSSTSTTSTTSTTLVGCGPSPRLGCMEPSDAKVTIKETIPGHERLKITLKGLVPAVTQADFGDPATGSTRYDVCVYSDAVQLVGDLTVDRAAEVCGNPPKVCWLSISDKGYRYVDRDAAAGGMQKLVARGGAPGRGKIVVKAGNNATRAQTAMPVGITAALEGTLSVTLQVLASDGDCFGATLRDIQSAEDSLFRASGAPVPLPTTTSTTSTTSTSTTTLPCGTFLSTWGSPGTGDGQFDTPSDVATDTNGDVYVTDLNNHRIQKFDGAGTFLTQWGALGTGDGQFNRPYGVATDASGNVYVAEASNHRIQKFTTNGMFLLRWGGLGTSDGQFQSPHRIAASSGGDVYVADTYNHRIQTFTGGGTFVSKWGTAGAAAGQFAYPAGVATDASGDVYIVDTNNNRIQKFSASGTFLTMWGAGGTGDGQFNLPYDIAIDALGSVFVVDYDNNRVQKFTASGTFVTKWGTYGTNDGQFSRPVGIAADASGNVYVADTYNHRVQKFACP